MTTAAFYHSEDCRQKDAISITTALSPKTWGFPKRSDGAPCKRSQSLAEQGVGEPILVHGSGDHLRGKDSYGEKSPYVLNQ